MAMSGMSWWTTDVAGFRFGNIYDAEFQEVLFLRFSIHNFYRYAVGCALVSICNFFSLATVARVKAWGQFFG